LIKAAEKAGAGGDQADRRMIENAPPT